MTTTIELIDWLNQFVSHRRIDEVMDDNDYKKVKLTTTRLRELDEQVKQQINDYGRGMAVADLAIKPDCVWVKLPCGRDASGNDISSYDPGCITVYTDDPLPMKLTKFCHLCGGSVKDAT